MRRREVDVIATQGALLCCQDLLEDLPRTGQIAAPHRERSERALRDEHFRMIFTELGSPELECARELGRGVVEIAELEIARADGVMQSRDERMIRPERRLLERERFLAGGDGVAEPARV